MKRILNLLFIVLTVFGLNTFVNAQGLDSIQVETYYVSNGTDGLPTGSKTYRVFVDLTDGYELAGYYGFNADVMEFKTTTSFYNVEDTDNGIFPVFAHQWGNAALPVGTTAADTWLSFGSGGANRFGILKTLDPDAGFAASPLVNSGGEMGLAITAKDGRKNTSPFAIAAAPAGAYDIEATTNIFNNGTMSTFTTNGIVGGWAVAGPTGARTLGPVGSGNRVLIGQFTTDGDFTFRLNLKIQQVGATTQNDYSANTAAASLGLVRAVAVANAAPTVSITSSPAAVSGAVVAAAGTSVTVTAVPADTDGTIASVEFFDGATSLGVINAPAAFTYTTTTSATTKNITAKTTDNLGLVSVASNAISISIPGNVVPSNALSASPVSIVTGGSSTLTSLAADTDGSIVDVKFYTTSGGLLSGGTLVSTDADGSNGYTFIVNPTSTQQYYSVATDNSGATTTSNLATVTVTADPAPTVTAFTATPSATPLYPSQSVALSATATDAVSAAQGIASGRFVEVNGSTFTTIGAIITGAGPFTGSYVPTSAGAKNLAFIVTDNSGNTASLTASVTVTADPAPVVTPVVANPTTALEGTAVALTSTATDAFGTIVSGQFFDGASAIGAAITPAAPVAGVYSFATSWTPSARGTKSLTLRVTDNAGNSATSTATSFEVTSSLKYEVKPDTALCNEENICVAIQTVSAVTDVIGYDFEMLYDKNKVVPTGVIRKFGDLAPVNLYETTYRIAGTSTSTGRMFVSVFFNSNAPLTQRFANAANNKSLVCVEFAKRPSFGSNESLPFVIDTLEESYITGVIGQDVKTNNFVTYRDTTFSSRLEFWADRSPLTNATAGNPTNIFGSNAACVKAPNPVTPDVNGEFTHYLNDNELFLNIERDILGGAGVPAITDVDVQPVINGFDALLVRKVLVEDASFVPNIYQAIAMDVNLDGQISAGDASQINQRAIKQIGEFRQRGNYDNAGVSNGTLSKDWLFIDELTILTNNNGNYSVSALYPKWDNTGYNKDHVPTLAFCRPTPVTDWSRCAVIGQDKYIGILLGDVNGNYQNLVAGVIPGLRSNDAITLDLSKALVANNKITVPVIFNASSDVNAVDFSLQFNEEVMSFVSASSALESNMTYFNENDRTLRFTSSSLKNLAQGTAVAFVTFETKGQVSERDFSNGNGYINGEKVNVTINNDAVSTTEELSSVAIYPNPTSGILNIVSSVEGTVELFDISGRNVMNLGKLNKDLNSFNVSALNNGVYTMKLTSGASTEVKKFILTK